MRKTHFLILIICLLYAVHTQAQRRMEDVLYLKNGSILRGKILDMDKESVSIEIMGGSVFVYPSSEVKGVTTEKKKVDYKKYGYMFALETGILNGRSPKGNSLNAGQPVNSFTFQCINGYQFIPELATGIGIGIDSYQNYVITPLYIRVSGTLFDHFIAPVYILDAGYGFYSDLFNDTTTGNSRGGIMLNPAAGVRVRVGKSNSLMITGGYRFQKFSTVTAFGAPGDGIRENSTYKRLSIRAGFMF